MKLDYKINAPMNASQFIRLLKASTLGERRPIDNEICMQGMVENSNLIISAWVGDELVGVARSMTDFHYACYMSDLAVDMRFQRQGIGKKLIELTQQQIRSTCKLILIAAPAANDYYRHLGFEHNERCWVMATNPRRNEF